MIEPLFDLRDHGVGQRAERLDISGVEAAARVVWCECEHAFEVFERRQKGAP